MLELAGIRDADWLRAVLHHHEQEDGGGYPTGKHRCRRTGLAGAARRRVHRQARIARTRDAMAADLAGRQMFMQDPGHPMTAALGEGIRHLPAGLLCAPGLG
jgi:hypothetical protein